MAHIQLSPLSTEKTVPFSIPRVKRQDKPAYMIGGMGFFDDTARFRAAGSAIYFDGEPNLDFYPLNKLAHERKSAYIDKLNELGEKAAKLNKKAYTPITIEGWDENADHDDLPEPKFVMMPTLNGSAEEIR